MSLLAFLAWFANAHFGILVYCNAGGHIWQLDDIVLAKMDHSTMPDIKRFWHDRLLLDCRICGRVRDCLDSEYLSMSYSFANNTILDNVHSFPQLHGYFYPRS